MNWWENFYDENLSQMLLRSKDAEQETLTCDFLKNILHLRAGDRIFDQCCGEGRLSLALESQGFDIIGVDQCAVYIETANTSESSATFICGDAFDFTPPAPVDAAFNWWTSFGYSSDDSENIKMIERAYASLKPGGRFALDFLNAPNILADFKDEVVIESENAEGPTRLLRKSSFDFFTGLFSTHWIYTMKDDSTITHQSHVRMYMPVDLVSMFTKVGFTNIEMFGDESGTSLDRHSRRCIVVGQKK